MGGSHHQIVGTSRVTDFGGYAHNARARMQAWAALKRFLEATSLQAKRGGKAATRQCSKIAEISAAALRLLSSRERQQPARGSCVSNEASWVRGA